MFTVQSGLIRRSLVAFSTRTVAEEDEEDNILSRDPRTATCPEEVEGSPPEFGSLISSVVETLTRESQTDGELMEEGRRLDSPPELRSAGAPSSKTNHPYPFSVVF